MKYKVEGEKLTNFVENYRCTLCHQDYAIDESLLTCPSCGETGILDIVFNYKKLKNVMTLEYLKNNKDYSMWRYQPLLSIDEVHPSMLKIGWTPLYESNNLIKSLKIKKLFIKDEGVNPSASLKDRASGVAVLKAKALGHQTIACSSTGNAASSLACHAARMGLKTVIFVPKRAPIGKLTQLAMYGAHLICVDGDYQDAFNLSKQAIDHYGWYNRNAAINPHLVEGKKTVALEICEQLDFNPTDWIVVSVGDGCTIAGVYKGLYDFMSLGLIKKMPRLLGVQSEGCSPFYKAYVNQRSLEVEAENTIADSIAVGKPRNPIKALNAVTHSGGSWITVTDDEILKSMKLLGEKEGIFGEPAGVAALAGLIKAVDENLIKSNETVSIIMTGNGLKDPVNAQKAINQPKIIKPDLKELHTYLENKGDLHHV